MSTCKFAGIGFAWVFGMAIIAPASAQTSSQQDAKEEIALLDSLNEQAMKVIPATCARKEPLYVKRCEQLKSEMVSNLTRREEIARRIGVAGPASASSPPPTTQLQAPSAAEVKWGMVGRTFGRTYTQDVAFKEISPNQIQLGNPLMIATLVSPRKGILKMGTSSVGDYGLEFTFADNGWIVRGSSGDNEVAYTLNARGDIVEQAVEGTVQRAGFGEPHIYALDTANVDYQSFLPAVLERQARSAPVVRRQSELEMEASFAKDEADFEKDQARQRQARQPLVDVLTGLTEGLARMGQDARSSYRPALNSAPQPGPVAQSTPSIPQYQAQSLRPPTYVTPTAPTVSPSVPFSLPSGTPFTAGENNSGRPSQPGSPASNAPTSNARVGSQCVTYDGINLVNGCSFPVSVRFCLTGANSGDWAAQFSCPNTGQVGPMPPGERRQAGRGHAYWVACEGRALFIGSRWTGSALRVERCE